MPRACPVLPMYPRFRDRLGPYGKAPDAWDKGATHVLHVKHTDPPTVFYTPDLFAGNKCAPAVLVLRDSGTVNWEDGSVFDIQDMRLCYTLIPGTRYFLG